jgi:hypothetical protein
MDTAIAASIATATVSVLAPYLKKAAEKASEKLGELTVSYACKKTKEIYEKLSGALAPHDPATTALQRLVESPEDSQCQTEMTKNLEAALLADTTLAQSLVPLLKEVAAAGADTEFHTNIHGEVQKFVQIGIVQGDVNL